MEEVAKKLKMGFDAQKSFAQVHKDIKMNKWIGGKMMKLDPVIIEEPRKEIGTREPQSPFKIRGKSHNLARIFVRTILTKGGTPLDYRFRWQKTRRNQGFQVWVRALTCCPSLVTSRLHLHILALSRFFGSHSKVHWSLHAHALANPNPRTRH